MSRPIRASIVAITSVAIAGGRLLYDIYIEAKREADKKAAEKRRVEQTYDDWIRRQALDSLQKDEKTTEPPPCD